jgi:hypothetical protein
MIFTAPGRFESALATPVVAESVEVAVAAGGAGGRDSDDDWSSHADRKQKPSGGGIILGRTLESRSDHRGMGSVTTTIGDRKRKSAGGPI